jgi:hypothetical protein
MPVTTATRLEDLTARPDLLPEGLRLSAAPQIAPGSRRRRRSSTLLWGAAAVVLLVAVAIIVNASLQ